MQNFVPKRILLIFGVLTLLLIPLLSHAQWKLMNADVAFPAGKRIFNTVADDKPLTSSKLKAGMAPPVSSSYAAALAKSGAEYDSDNFAAAAQHLEALASQPAVAPAILNQYARSLYRVEGGKARSYAAYQQLIALLDEYGGGEDDATCVLYLPFQEAYYKLATLQMDSEQWVAAAYNISRTLMVFQALPRIKEANAALYEQALQYQTECFANLSETALCRHFGQRTVKLFPQNQYVGPYLTRLPPAKAKPTTQKRAASARS